MSNFCVDLYLDKANKQRLKNAFNQPPHFPEEIQANDFELVVESLDEQPEAAPKGKLKIDATVTDQYIRFLTDLSLVNEARVKTEEPLLTGFGSWWGHSCRSNPVYPKLSHLKYN